MKQLRNLKEGNSCSLKLPQKKERKEKRERIRGNEDGGVSEVLEEAVMVFFLLTQTVSSYVLPSLLIFIPEMPRQEYKAGSAGSDDFGQISLLLLLTGSKYPISFWSLSQYTPTLSPSLPLFSA